MSTPGTPEPLSEETLTKWQRLCEVASQGPLSPGPGTNDGLVRDGAGFVIADCHGHEGNAEFFAAARTAIPLLLAELHRLREERKGCVALLRADAALIAEVLDVVSYRDWVAWHGGTHGELERLKALASALAPKGDEPNG